MSFSGNHNLTNIYFASRTVLKYMQQQKVLLATEWSKILDKPYTSTQFNVIKFPAFKGCGASTLAHSRSSIWSLKLMF